MRMSLGTEFGPRLFDIFQVQAVGNADGPLEVEVKVPCTYDAIPSTSISFQANKISTDIVAKTGFILEGGREKGKRGNDSAC